MVVVAVKGVERVLLYTTSMCRIFFPSENCSKRLVARALWRGHAQRCKYGNYLVGTASSDGWYFAKR